MLACLELKRPKSARGISKFEIAAAGPSHCEAAKKCSDMS